MFHSFISDPLGSRHQNMSSKSLGLLVLVTIGTSYKLYNEFEDPSVTRFREYIRIDTSQDKNIGE